MKFFAIGYYIRNNKKIPFRKGLESDSKEETEILVDKWLGSLGAVNSYHRIEERIPEWECISFKKCSKCTKTKPISDFYKYRESGKLLSICKSCYLKGRKMARKKVGQTKTKFAAISADPEKPKPDTFSCDLLKEKTKRFEIRNVEGEVPKRILVICLCSKKVYLEYSGSESDGSHHMDTYRGECVECGRDMSLNYL